MVKRKIGKPVKAEETDPEDFEAEVDSIEDEE